MPQVLFDFLLAWGNYKHAAAAMLAFARRMRSMAASAAGTTPSEQQQLMRIVAEVQAAYGESAAVLWYRPMQPLTRVPFSASYQGLYLAGSFKMWQFVRLLSRYKPRVCPQAALSGRYLRPACHLASHRALHIA
jgi:hypothetical protein